jgi:hypothetical protein
MKAFFILLAIAIAYGVVLAGLGILIGQSL